MVLVLCVSALHALTFECRALKNNRTNMYATIGLTTSATSQWKMMSTSISRPDRYINKEGEIKFRLKGNLLCPQNSHLSVFLHLTRLPLTCLF